MIALGVRARRIARLGVRVVHGLFEHHAFDHAAAMAFYFFLGFIPLLVLAGLVVGNVVHERGAENLVQPLFRVMPAAAVELIQRQLHLLEGTSFGSLAPLSLGGFVVLASNGIHNLMDVFELVAGARPRAWWKQRLWALGWVAGSIAACVGIPWLLFFASGLAERAEGVSLAFLPESARQAYGFLQGGWNRLGLVVTIVAIASSSLGLFYRWGISHPRSVRRSVWPGTATAMIAWALASFGFANYVKTVGHYDVYYGGVAAIASVLIWLYLTSLAFMLGAEVNTQLELARADAA